MIVATLLGLSVLVTPVAFEPTDRPFVRQMTPQQKFTAIRPLIRSATECVVHAITADPRFRASIDRGDVTELIVASMAPCAGAMRAMIEEHDRLFGEGSGEAFFMGPYLEGLPLTVNKLVNGAAAPESEETGR